MNQWQPSILLPRPDLGNFPSTPANMRVLPPNGMALAGSDLMDVQGRPKRIVVYDTAAEFSAYIAANRLDGRVEDTFHKAGELSINDGNAGTPFTTTNLNANVSLIYLVSKL